jgi:hypothetical protein
MPGVHAATTVAAPQTAPWQAILLAAPARATMAAQVHACHCKGVPAWWQPRRWQRAACLNQVTPSRILGWPAGPRASGGCSNPGSKNTRQVQPGATTMDGSPDKMNTPHHACAHTASCLCKKRCTGGSCQLCAGLTGYPANACAGGHARNRPLQLSRTLCSKWSAMMEQAERGALQSLKQSTYTAPRHSKHPNRVCSNQAYHTLETPSQHLQEPPADAVLARAAGLP